MTIDEDAYNTQRAALAMHHDSGANEALREAVDMTVDCLQYCYGGSANLDLQETLANLTEQGWRLIRAAPDEVVWLAAGPLDS